MQGEKYYRELLKKYIRLLGVEEGVYYEGEVYAGREDCGVAWTRLDVDEFGTIIREIRREEEEVRLGKRTNPA